MRALLSALLMAGLAGGYGFTADEKRDSLKDKVSALRKEIKRDNQPRVKELNKKLREAKTEEEEEKIQEQLDTIRAKGGDRILDLVREMPKDEYAFDATMVAFDTGSQSAGDYLVANFVNDERLAKAIPKLIAGENGEKILAVLAEKSSNRNVKGFALFQMVSREIESNDDPETNGMLPEKEAAAKMAATALKLDAILKEYGDVKIHDDEGKAKTVAEAGKRVKFFVENLVVGKKAPDVECALLEAGKKAKLSDYKGKVVVLDIWATWCGPCRAMIPHEREMVKHFEGKPFALVSVSADEKKETLTKFLAKTEMPWTHWWNGENGKLTETLQVQFYPTIFVIDAKGVIRAKHLRGDDLQKFCDQLVKEAEGKPSE